MDNSRASIKIKLEQYLFRGAQWAAPLPTPPSHILSTGRKTSGDEAVEWIEYTKWRHEGCGVAVFRGLWSGSVPRRHNHAKGKVSAHTHTHTHTHTHAHDNVSNITFQCSASSLNNTARSVCMTSLVTQGWQTRSFLHQSHFVSQHAGSPCYNRLTQTADSTLCYWYRSVLSATDQGYAYCRNILTVRCVFF